MTELCTRFTNNSTTNLFLFQIVFKIDVDEDAKAKMTNPIKKNTEFLLKERPGLHRITYTAKYDYLNFQKILPQICEKAMQLKEVNVNILYDFLQEVTSAIPLF